MMKTMRCTGAAQDYRCIHHLPIGFRFKCWKEGIDVAAVPVNSDRKKASELVSKQSDFSLHAAVACKSNQVKKLERPGGVPLCRYITRPAIAEQRLSVASNGNVIVALKTPYDDGTSHVVLSPMVFIGRLAALVPKPRVN
jgi:hypothetical protein